MITSIIALAFVTVGVLRIKHIMKTKFARSSVI
jgi:hypothetical protein